MNNIPIGAYTFSDSYLRKLKKDDLIEHYRTLEKNWFNEIKSSNIQIDNLKKLLKEEYNKAIDDFVKFASDMPTVETENGEIRPMWLEEIAEQLKAGGENEI